VAVSPSNLFYLVNRIEWYGKNGKPLKLSVTFGITAKYDGRLIEGIIFLGYGNLFKMIKNGMDTVVAAVMEDTVNNSQKPAA
jgi:hypothetical protein